MHVQTSSNLTLELLQVGSTQETDAIVGVTLTFPRIADDSRGKGGRFSASVFAR